MGTKRKGAPELQPQGANQNKPHANSTPPQGQQLSFLPPPPLALQMPSPGTKPALALAQLLTGARLTQREFLHTGKSWRLAAAVYELGRMGWPVLSERLAAPSAIAPGRTVAGYRLEPERLAELRVFVRGAA